MTGHRLTDDLMKVDPYTGEVGDGEKIVPRTGYEYKEIKTGGAETATLPDPTTLNQFLTLHMTEDNGNMVVTSSTKVNVAGNNTLTFADVDDLIVLMSVMDGSGGYRWNVLSNDGVALSTV